MKSYSFVAALFFAVLASSCGDDNVVTPPGNNNSNDPRNSVHFHVTWAPETTVIDSTMTGAIKSIDSSRYIFTFGSGNAKIDALKRGDIIAVGDYAIRRVTSVQKSGSDVVVQTDTCRLTDAIIDADISWDYGVPFTPQYFASAFRKAGVTPRYVSNDSLGAEFEVGDLTHAISFKFGSESAKIVIKTTKKKSDLPIAEFVCEGTLNKFRQKGEIKIKDRKLRSFENRNNELNADFTLSMAAAAAGNEIGIDYDISIIKFPIPDLPFLEFEMACKIVLNMFVPPDGSTLVKARFIYEADQGVRYVEGSGIVPFANIKSEKVEKANEPRTGASGPVGVSWGLGFPRMSIGIIGTKTKAWVQPAYLIGGDYTMIPPCQQAKAQFIGSCGWGLGAFGVTIANGSKTLWQKETILLKAGQCP